MRKESATLVLAQKITHHSGRIEELKVWKVKASLKYPDGEDFRKAVNGLEKELEK